MKIVLVAPLMYLNKSDTQPHLGLFSLKATLRQHGYAVELVSLSPILTEPYEAYQSKEDVLPADFYQKAVVTLLAFNPDIVGFSTIGSSYPTTLLLVKMLKTARPNLTVILGGIQASLCARETMRYFPEVDYIIAGEAELTLPIFLQHLAEGSAFPPASGIYYRNDLGDIAFTGNGPLINDLDILPMMDYSEVDISTLSEINIDVGRGCPFQCYYCCTNNYWRRTHRLRSAKNIADEIEYHYKTSGKQLFAFNHDLLTCNHTVFRELLETLKTRNLPIRWRCSSRIDTIDLNLLKNMAEAGCYDIFLGIETGSARMQKVIRKNLDLTRVFPLLEECYKLHIRCTVSFICGMPEETIEDLVQTVAMIFECVARYASPQIHLLAPFQGTDLYLTYKDQLSFDGKSSNVGGFTINNPQEKALIEAYPDIFCNFYYVENPHISREILRNIEYFPRLLQYFWRTIGILLYSHQIDLQNILLAFLEHPVKTSEMGNFIGQWVQSVQSPRDLLKEVFAFEQALFSSKLDHPAPTPTLKVEPAHYFRQSPGSKLYHLPFDLPEVEKAIRQHLPHNGTQPDQALAALISTTYPGMMPGYCIVPANSAAVNIYNDANGQLRVQDIIDEAANELKETHTYEQIQETVIGLFRQLITLRLIVLESSKNIF